eukprot:1846331-Rhodomonas_salina.1
MSAPPTRTSQHVISLAQTRQTQTTLHATARSHAGRSFAEAGPHRGARRRRRKRQSACPLPQRPPASLAASSLADPRSA